MRLNRRKSIILALFIIVGFFVLAQLTAPSNSGPELLSGNRTNTEISEPSITAEPTASSTPAEQSQFELQNFNRSETRDGRKIWEVTAENGKYFPEKEITTLYKPIIVSAKNKDRPFTLESEEADIVLAVEGLKQAHARKNVVVTIDEGVTLKTEEAIYNHESQKVVAPRIVNIKGPFYTTRGDSMDVDLETEKIVITGNIKTVIEPVEKKEKKKRK